MSPYDLLKMAAVANFQRKFGCDVREAALAASALHPLDNAQRPANKRLEKDMRKLSRRFAKASRRASDAAELRELTYDVLATYAVMARACGDTYYQLLFEHAALEAQVETSGQRIDEERPRPDDRPVRFALSPEAAAVAKVHSIDFAELVETADQRWATVVAEMRLRRREAEADDLRFQVVDRVCGLEILAAAEVSDDKVARRRSVERSGGDSRSGDDCRGGLTPQQRNHPGASAARVDAASLALERRTDLNPKSQIHSR